MPITDVVFYREDENSIPALEWLEELSKSNVKAYVKCKRRVEMLRNEGYELKRPYADFLRDEIYELRIKLGTVNYRLLYFFQGKVAAVIACGLTKEAGVPPVEINRAIERKKKLLKNPRAHVYRER
jgi:hypothetical protein